MTVSREVKQGRPCSVWYVVAKNHISETGFRHGSYTHRVRSEGEAYKLADSLLRSSQTVHIYPHSVSCSQFIVLSKRGFKEVILTKRS